MSCSQISCILKCKPFVGRGAFLTRCVHSPPRGEGVLGSMEGERDCAVMCNASNLGTWTVWEEWGLSHTTAEVSFSLPLLGVIIRIEGSIGYLPGPAAPDGQSLCGHKGVQASWAPTTFPELGLAVRTEHSLLQGRSRAVIEATCGALAQGKLFLKHIRSLLVGFFQL